MNSVLLSFSHWFEGGEVALKSRDVAGSLGSIAQKPPSIQNQGRGRGVGEQGGGCSACCYYFSPYRTYATFVTRMHLDDEKTVQYSGEDEYG